MRAIILTGLFLTLSLFSISAQKRVYVKQNNNAQQDGQNWTTAFSDLQQALQTAQPGDSVWVAAGTYRPTAGNLRTATFNITSGIRLYAGFKGIETNVDERNWKANRVILSGDIGQPDDSLDNSYNVVYMENPDSFTIFDGFQVEYGQADSITPTGGGFQRWRSGAGLFIQANDGIAYPFIRNCLFTHNTTESHVGAIFINGGGIGSVAPAIENCFFVENRAGFDGGAVYRRGSSWVDTPNDFSRCTFRANHAGRAGGGIFIRDAPRTDTIEFRGSAFIKNTAGVRATAINIQENRFPLSTLKFENCLFDSSAVYPPLLNVYAFIFCDFFTEQTDFVFKNVTFKTTTFNRPVYAIDFPRDVNVQNCTFENDGKGVSQYILTDLTGRVSLKSNKFISSTIYKSDIGTLTMVHNCEYRDFELIPDSLLPYISKGYGGLIGKNIDYKGNLFFDKKKSLPIQVGFGSKFMKVSNLQYETNPDSTYQLPTTPTYDTLRIYNSIFKDEWLFTKGYLNSKYTELHNCHFGSMDVAALPPHIILGAGNTIGVDPMFRDSAAGDFRLLPCSPLIDAGTNSVIQNYPTDLDSNARIANGIVDIGPYESKALEAKQTATVKSYCGPLPAGSVQFHLENGCPPYAFNWQNATSTGTDTTNLAAGNYIFTITDQKGRQYLDTVLIKGSNPTVSIIGDENLCPGDSTGMLTATVTGAAEPVGFEWNNGETIPALSNLPEGEYIIEIIDNAGCTSTDTAKIEEAAKTSVNATTKNATGPTNPDGSIVIDLISGLPPFQFLWSNGDTTGNPGNLLPGDYVLSITNGIGCLDTVHFKVDFTIKTNESGADGPAFVLPNPANDRAELHWGSFGHFRLFNHLGQLMIDRERQLDNPEMELSQFKPGIYRFVFLNKNGAQAVGKLMVVH